MTTTELVLAKIAKHLHHPDLHASLSPDANLAADLALTQIDLWGVACDLEEELGFRFDGDPELHWHTPADIVAAIEQVAA